MLTFIFILLLFAIFGKLCGFALKAAWSLFKIVFVIGFWPILLIGLVLYGLLYVAWPILLVFGIIVLIKTFSQETVNA